MCKLGLEGIVSKKINGRIALPVEKLEQGEDPEGRGGDAGAENPLLDHALELRGGAE